MRYVNKAIPKTDGMALTSGKGLYTDDLAPRDCLVVKVLRSPYAFARIKSIRKETASRVTGIACILTWEDVPKIRYTLAGQSYPEPSPYDRYILDQVVRYVGDPVAIVAGRDEASVDKAMRMIQVKYEVLEPVIDFEKALDNPSVIHPESDYHTNFNIGGDPSRNLVSSGCESDGDVEAALAGCDVVVDRTYYTKANAQAMMETFSTYTWLDQTGRLNVTSSTQVPFHCRRIIAHALGLPQGAVRVTKPRIGGGFGAKQTLVSELFPALVTLRTGRPAKIVFPPGGLPGLQQPPPDAGPCPGRRHAGRHHQGGGHARPLQCRRLRRARLHHRGPGGPQEYPPLRQGRRLPLHL